MEYFSTENGLSHQAVTSIIKDQEGFMWFGSWDGINRFDGRSFVSFKSFPGDLSQLGNDRIDQIVEDQSDHLWLQAYDKQVYRFDKKSEQFWPLSDLIGEHGKQTIAFSRVLAASNGWVWLQAVNEGLYGVPQKDIKPATVIAYKKGLPAEHSLPSNTINFFYEDREKRIWVGTPVGLACLAMSSSGDYKNSNINLVGITDVDFTVVEEDKERLYFGTADGRLVIYNKKLNSFAPYKISGDHLQGLLRSAMGDNLYATTTRGQLITFNLNDHTITTATYSPGEQLFSIYEDRKGILWLEPRSQGIVRYDPLSRTFNHFVRENTDRLNAINNHVRVWEDNNGLVWVLMKGGGFGYYNAAAERFDYSLNTPDAGISLLPNNLYSVYFDEAGVFWITTNERQLIKIMLQSNVFKQQLLTSEGGSKYDNEVRGIFYDNKGRLWMGTKNGKLYVYQNDKSVTGLFDNEPPEGLGMVYSIMQDSRGNIWLGAKSNGLYKAVPVNKEGTKYHLQHFVSNKNGGNLPCNEVYAILEDRQGRIWLGSFDKGVYLLKEAQDNLQFIPAVALFKNYPKEAFQKVRHMALDANGNIWAGTTNGLLLLQTGDGGAAAACSMYQKIPGDKNSLGNNDIQFVLRDSKNRMWLATSGGGVCLAKGNQPFQELHFRNYTTKDGMSNDYVLSGAEDARGKLWFATENGLSRFDPEKMSFRNYDSYDGLPRASFSEAAVCSHLPNRQLIFGTTKGSLTFDPAGINNNRIVANIAFTNLQINNADAGSQRNDSELTLKYNQDLITIEYAILDQRAGNRHALVYRLLGFDSTWYSDRQQRRTTYTNLPPGHYVFEVKSVSTDLYSNTPYKRVAITILPPPWKTGWAYIIYILFIGVLLVIIRRYALAMIRLRNKIAIEKRLAAMKVNFFTNISHELRTPLTLILNPIEQLLRKEKLSAEGAAWVRVARKNANRMVRFINQLLDLRKVESNKATLHMSRVEIGSFVHKISDHFTEALNSKHISLAIKAEQEVVAWVDAEKLDIVIFNLLANAVKFTPEGKAISMAVSQVPADQSFLIAVSDQGPGVEADKLKEIFDLFYETEHPATTQKGSGIGLALSKELVHLHGGDIWAVNNENGGLTVSVKIRTGTGHDKPGEPVVEEMHPETPDYMEYDQPEQAHAATLPDNPQAPLVLLVEDNEELRLFLSSQLSECYRVEVACNGEEGWQKAGHLIPDLILSDIMMPVMDGIQMLDKIKNDINTSHIPVVLLSAKYSIESRIEGLRYGADCYITKPFHNEFLMASIDNLLRQRKKLFNALVSKKPATELSPSAIVVTSGDETFLKEVIRVVEEKMTDPGFSMETVAESMNMSRSAFYKKFKSLTGLTTVEFVRDMRLQRSKQYFDGGSTNIAEVAYWSGFSNPKYFSTCFREKYHVSPSDYLKAVGK